MILDAQHGLRPTRTRIELGAPPLALLSGPPPDRARRAVLALHGRGAEAGGIVRRYTEIAGHDPETAVIGLRTVAGNRWYGVRYGEPGAGADTEVVAALDRVDAALAALAGHIPRDRTVLAGFSQGACLALEYAARRGAGLAAVIAPCGARIGLPSGWAAGQRASPACRCCWGRARRTPGWTANGSTPPPPGSSRRAPPSRSRPIPANDTTSRPGSACGRAS